MNKDVICPKCGVKDEYELANRSAMIVCTNCFEKFVLPYDIVSHFDEMLADTCEYAGINNHPYLDSSFWLS